MIIEDCPNCTGPNCTAYQKQRQHHTLGTRANVEAGIIVPDGWVHDVLRKVLTTLGQIREADVFQIHTLPGEDGSTDYVALLANRLLSVADAE